MGDTNQETTSARGPNSLEECPLRPPTPTSHTTPSLEDVPRGECPAFTTPAHGEDIHRTPTGPRAFITSRTLTGLSAFTTPARRGPSAFTTPARVARTPRTLTGPLSSSTAGVQAMPHAHTSGRVSSKDPTQNTKHVAGRLSSLTARDEACSGQGGAWGDPAPA
ncbi:hypothetical protein ACOMHN_050175 [Nucella lapillus]